MSPLLLTGYLILCLFIAVAGRKLRFGFWGYFFASIFLTPVLGILLLLAAVPVARRREVREAPDRS
jgi:hypothetical protein